MPRLPQRQPVDRARRAFEAALARELLVSERRRVTSLAAVLGGVLLFWLLSLVLFPTTAELEAQYGLVVRRSVLIATLAGALAYELIVRTFIGHFLRTGRQPLL